MKKGYTGLPAAIYVIIMALIVIGVMFLFYVVLQGKYDIGIDKAFDAMKVAG